MQRSVGGFEDLTVRLSGDSGDGIQLAGEQLALAATIDGNEVMTLADFPSEIRPPEGTLGRFDCLGRHHRAHYSAIDSVCGVWGDGQRVDWQAVHGGYRAGDHDGYRLCHRLVAYRPH